MPISNPSLQIFSSAALSPNHTSYYLRTSINHLEAFFFLLFLTLLQLLRNLCFLQTWIKHISKRLFAKGNNSCATSTLVIFTMSVISAQDHPCISRISVLLKAGKEVSLKLPSYTYHPNFWGYCILYLYMDYVLTRWVWFKCLKYIFFFSYLVF